MMPKMTVGINTAQIDYPYSAYPDVHLFEMTMKSLREQTFKDFEVVVADVNYEQRKNYFIDHPEDFPVNHVPIKPNIWIPFNHMAIATTKNTILLHAKGDIITSVGSSVRLDKYFLEAVLSGVTEDCCVVNRFSINCGEKIIFHDGRDPADSHSSVHGNVSMTKENWMLINGYDEMLDGCKGLEDCDIGIRLVRAGKKIKLIGPKIVYEDHVTYYPLLRDGPGFQKCPHLLLEISKKRSQIRANETPLTDQEYSYLKMCKLGDQRDSCILFPDQPCIHCTEDNKCYFGEEPELMGLYKHPSLIFDLKEMRKNIDSAILALIYMCSLEELKEFIGG